MKSIKTLLILCLALVWAKFGNAQSCNASFTSNGYYFYEGDTVVFKNTSTHGSSSTIQYYWNLGDGTASNSQSNVVHVYSKAGAYSICLTIFDSINNCQDVYCDSIIVAPDTTQSGCSASFSYRVNSQNDCTIHFDNNSNATSNARASWTFGDGNGSGSWSTQHSYKKDGWYGVVLVISDSINNCSSIAYDSIYVNGCDSTVSNKTHFVTGQIICSNYPAQSGIVYLIRKDSTLIYSVDSTYLDSSGYYYFGNVKTGNYYIKAALTKIDPNYNDYLPTYYGNVLRWDSAMVLWVGQNERNVNIDMINGTNTGGIGFIGGDVTKGANKKAGEPLNNIQVTILNQNLMPVAYAYSNVNGKFELPNLALGRYFLFVDITGLKTEGTWIELTESNPKVEDVKIEINSNTISTGISNASFESNNSLKIYPNPAQNYLVVSFNHAVAQMEIIDINGKLLFSEKVSNNETINLSQLEKGTYFLQLKSASNSPVILQRQVLIKN